MAARSRAVDRAFAEIAEDLRSQYSIVYQSSNRGDGFRTVEVHTLRRGVDVRAPRGYYP